MRFSLILAAVAVLTVSVAATTADSEKCPFFASMTASVQGAMVGSSV